MQSGLRADRPLDAARCPTSHRRAGRGRRARACRAFRGDDRRRGAARSSAAATDLPRNTRSRSDEADAMRPSAAVSTLLFVLCAMAGAAVGAGLLAATGQPVFLALSLVGGVLLGMVVAASVKVVAQ